MNTTSKSTLPRSKYHRNAYDFVFDSLRHAQQRYDLVDEGQSDDEEHHISGQDLLDGIRELAIEQFGMLAITVFRRWGVHSTADFGRIVFELIEHGRMRKTERDQLSDFFDVYDFEEVFDHDYEVDTRHAFDE